MSLGLSVEVRTIAYGTLFNSGIAEKSSEGEYEHSWK